MMLGKLQIAHPTLRGHFAPTYLVGSNMLRAYQFFIYDYKDQKEIIRGVIYPGTLYQSTFRTIVYQEI